MLPERATLRPVLHLEEPAAREPGSGGWGDRDRGTLPQIKIVHVKPVELPPNFRLGDDTIDLMKDFSLSSAQAIGGAWQTPPYNAPAITFDERYGQWWSRCSAALTR